MSQVVEHTCCSTAVDSVCQQTDIGDQEQERELYPMVREEQVVRRTGRTNNAERFSLQQVYGTRDNRKIAHD